MGIVKILIKAIWHPYWKWEESKYNMWGTVENKEEYLNNAIEFTGNNELYGKYMGMVVDNWKYSCEHNLSKMNQNRRAWLGQAACALAMQCPEDIVRKAWGFLTDEQRRLANDHADKHIKRWEERQCQNDQ
jgi:hypothetical protein